VKKILATIGLLICSNAFMNTAWYGHLKYKSSPLIVVIFASWGIALFEYCFQVPANRIGNDVLTVTQLKVIQEIISLTTFAIFASVVFKQRPTTNQFAAFILIVIAAYLIVKK
jgi:uncharacterized protein (DUF486 family)